MKAHQWVRIVDGVFKGYYLPVEPGPPGNVQGNGTPAYNVVYLPKGSFVHKFAEEHEWPEPLSPDCEVTVAHPITEQLSYERAKQCDYIVAYGGWPSDESLGVSP